MRRAVLFLITVLAVPSCTAGPPSAAAQPSPSPPGPSLPVVPPSASAPPFVGETGPVTAADVAASWRPGCPVGPDQLRWLRLSHWDFDGRPQVGALIVHEAVAAEVITVFETLYRERFPVRRMQPVDVYDGDDSASMAADNTSGFNCRPAVAEGAPRWSDHAYGRAIDVNPVENPYLFAGRVLPPAGAAYVDRDAARPGMALPGGVLVRAFAEAGWAWGGRWSDPDYQHFSVEG